MIRLACPSCKTILKCADDNAGHVVACSGCQKKLRVPALIKGNGELIPPKPKEKPIDDLEEVPAPASPRKSRPDNEEDVRDSESEEERDEEEEERRKRGRKKRRKCLDRARRRSRRTREC